MTAIVKIQAGKRITLTPTMSHSTMFLVYTGKRAFNIDESKIGT